ncbi:sigma-E processing peptidase SpoIIGA [Filobacillus milosensis]|uniref:sigma-E processing peptidase SpoIIGA n=1 Tax=Filobacillus milosensis TaxID=94137 RepID=UPI0018914851|nr:sigma-E processing peptidase SpoIIGA [Filobacillus milosensis]
MQIYLDLIWILNFFFDCLVLFVVAWVVRHPFSKWRVVLAGFYASLIIPLSFIPSLDWLNLPIIKALYSIGIILIAFSFQSMKKFFIYFFSFYFINFAIGGGLFGLHYFLQSQYIDAPWLTHISYGNMVSWIFILITFPLFLWFTKDRLQSLSVIKLKHEQLYDVVVKINENMSFHLKGFYDTGNQLTHPLMNKPIMLIDEPTAAEWFGSDKINELRNKSHLSPDYELPFEYIPLKKAGGDHGYIPVFQVKQVSIKVGQFIHSSKRVYVGVHFGEFSQSLNYNSLLHPLLFQSKNTKVQHVKGVI